ncbi:MAG: hypothetical protein RL213_2303 [Bacteroidota bacterium]
MFLPAHFRKALPVKALGVIGPLERKTGLEPATLSLEG